MSDKEIVALFVARDEGAIAATDKCYGRKLHVLANRILENYEDAEESVNDTYLQTWNTIPPQVPSCFFAYLAKICRHFALNRVYWKNAAKRKALVVELTQEMELCIPDAAIEREMEGRELGKILNSFLAALNPETRRIFLRRYWYVDTIAEIASRYGLTESKVKMQLSRTRAKLQTYLEKEGITL